jgi:hypothetical protein
MLQYNYILKIVYRVSVFLILFFMIQPIAGHFIPLEFASDSIRNDFESFRFFAFMLAILGTMAGTLKKCDGAVIIILKILLTLFAVFIAFFIALGMALGNMCGYNNHELLFIKKGNRNTTIVTRYFGCGATDSSPAVKRTVKQTRVTPFFIWATDIDTNRINKEEWVRIVKNK